MPKIRILAVSQSVSFYIYKKIPVVIFILHIFLKKESISSCWFPEVSALAAMTCTVKYL